MKAKRKIQNTNTNVYIYNGKDLIFQRDRKGDKVTASAIDIETGVVSETLKTVSVNDKNYVPVAVKDTLRVDLNPEAIKVAMDTYDQLNDKWLNAKGYCYAILKKENKVSGVLVEKKTATGYTCRLRLGTTYVTRTIPEEYLFETRAKALKAFDKGIHRESPPTPTTPKTTPVAPTTPTTTYKVVFVVVKGKVIPCSLIKDSGNTCVLRIPNHEAVYEVTMPKRIVYLTRTAAEQAAKQG